MGKFNTYDVSSYISIGFSEEEALAKVSINKERTRKGLRLRFVKKLFDSCGVSRENIDLELFLHKLEEVQEIQNSTRHAKRLLRVFSSISSFKNVSLFSAIDIYSDYCKSNPSKKRPLTNAEAVIYLFGEGSVEHIKLLGDNKNKTSCDFKKFSESYSDRNVALKEFKKKYGSSKEAVMMRHGVDEETACLILKGRIDKGITTFNRKSEEEKKSIAKSKGLSLSSYASKFGEKLGKEKYEEALLKRKNWQSLEWYQNKFGEEEGKVRYLNRHQKKNFIVCVEYWMARGYDEETAKLKLREYFNGRGNFSLSYCEEKYGKEHGYTVWKERTDKWQATLNRKPQHEKDEMNARKSISEAGYILRHGEEVGKKLYFDYLTKRETTTFTCASMSSLRFLKPLYDHLIALGIVSAGEVYWGVAGSKEWFITKNGKTRFYDFTIKKLKLIIEFNGVAFHAKEGDLNWVGAYGMSYVDAIDADVLKQQMADHAGFELMYVWEDEDQEIAFLRVMDVILTKYEEWKEKNNETIRIDV